MAAVFGPEPRQCWKKAGTEGHTILSREEIISASKNLNLSPALPATEDQYEIHGRSRLPVVVVLRSRERKARLSA